MRLIILLGLFSFYSLSLAAQQSRSADVLGLRSYRPVNSGQATLTGFSKQESPLANSLLLQGPDGHFSNDPKLRFLEPSDTLHKGRFWTSAAIGATIYTGVMIGLNEIWYAEFERSSFHFFNDLGEWEDMDKVGHLFTAYMEANWVYKGARWTGLEERKSIWLGVAMGSLFQASVETLDGFSAKWGFSVPDIAFNTLGVSAFAAQQLAWGEQRISLKVSSFHEPYPNYLVNPVNEGMPVSLRDRARSLYGSTYPEQFLKDYNAQTIWASVNIHSFMQDKSTRIPRWLNVAVGYGAENMFGGFENSWEDGDTQYILDADAFPRYRQFYLSLDIDLTRIKTKSPFLKTLFNLFNVIKIPAPALEVNTLGKVRLHGLYF